MENPYYSCKLEHVLGPGLKAMIRMGAGYDNVDCEACAARGVVASNCPDAWWGPACCLNYNYILGRKPGTVAANWAKTGRGTRAGPSPTALAA